MYIKNNKSSVIKTIIYLTVSGFEQKIVEFGISLPPYFTFFSTPLFTLPFLVNFLPRRSFSIVILGYFKEKSKNNSTHKLIEPRLVAMN